MTNFSVPCCSAQDPWAWMCLCSHELVLNTAANLPCWRFDQSALQSRQVLDKQPEQGSTVEYYMRRRPDQSINQLPYLAESCSGTYTRILLRRPAGRHLRVDDEKKLDNERFDKITGATEAVCADQERKQTSLRHACRTSKYAHSSAFIDTMRGPSHLLLVDQIVNCGYFGQSSLQC